MKEKHKDIKHKKKKSKKHKKRRESRSSSSDSSESKGDQWVEKELTPATSKQNTSSTSRDDWMSMTGLIATYSKDDLRSDKQEKEKKHIDSYNPATSVRELNPYWKDGGTGLPKSSEELRASKPFQRPDNGDDLYRSRHSKYNRPETNDDFVTSRKSENSLDSRSVRRPIDEKYSDTSTNSRNFKRPTQSDNFYTFSKSRTSSDYQSLGQSNDEKYCGKSTNSRNFKRPSDSDDFYGRTSKKPSKSDEHYGESSSNWRKMQESKSKETVDTRETSPAAPSDKPVLTDTEIKDSNSVPGHSEKYLSDEKMNKLAAKIVKAEIVGDLELVKKLKEKQEDARTYRRENPDAGKLDQPPEDIMLMSTNSRGDSRPLTKSARAGDPRSRGGKRKAQTHTAGERMKYFSNDDGQSLSQMFEQEKYSSNYEEEAQLAKIAAKHTNPNDDLEDIFTEEISKNINKGKEDEKNKQRSIKDHMKLMKSLEGCDYCVDSKSMLKHLIVSCGDKVYLAVPARTSLTKGHCIIATVQHATCATGLDEDVWEEVMNFRKALVNFFNSQDQDVVFFETAVRLNKYPHMVINCVPMPRDVGDTAPIYFKKALLECEAEWSMNKKVVDLKGKSIRRGVPKGLPYFWVDFGMDAGFAHVIEDQQLFPNNFAEEIIGGILDLDHQLWKRPHREHGDKLRQKVSEFALEWRKFDTVSKNKI